MRWLAKLLITFLIVGAISIPTGQAIPVNVEINVGDFSAGLGNVSYCGTSIPVMGGFLVELRDQVTHSVLAEFSMGEGTNVGPPDFLPRDGNFEVIYAPDSADLPQDVYLRAYNATVPNFADAYGDSAGFTVAGGGTLDLAGWSLCQSQVPRYDIPVGAEWNLVSFPTPANGSITTVLDDSAGDGNTTWDRAYAWRDTGSVMDWVSYDSSRPAYLNTLDTVSWIDGLWVHITTVGDGLLSVASLPFTGSQVRAVFSGWNLVGYGTVLPASVTDSLASISCPLVQSWDGMAYSSLSGADQLTPGSGYWFSCTSPGIWLT